MTTQTPTESITEGATPREHRAAPINRPRRTGRIGRLATPGWIRLLTTVSVLLAIVLGIAVSNATTNARAGMASLAGGSAPRVTTSADLAFALSDMDAQLANLLLAGSDPAFAAVQKQAQDLYDVRRMQVNSDLQQIAGVSGGNPSALATVRDEMNKLGEYQASAAAAHVVNLTDGAPAGHPSPTALQLYRPATNLMNDILAAALRLTNDEHNAVTAAYAAHQDQLLAIRLWVAILGGVLIVVLLALQVYLRVRLRRRLNPAIALATLVTGALAVAGFVMLTDEADHISASQRDFDSMVALSEARALSYDANANESRILLDPSRTAEFEKAFQDRSQQIANLPGVDISRYADALDTAITAYRANPANAGFGGYFGAELTHPGSAEERTAADHILAAYQVYQRDYLRLRDLAGRRNNRDAITFKLDSNSGGATYNFTQYDNALMSAVTMKKNGFDAAIAASDRALAGWDLVIPGLAIIIIAALVLIGVRPRLAEYR